MSHNTDYDTAGNDNAIICQVQSHAKQGSVPEPFRCKSPENACKHGKARRQRIGTEEKFSGKNNDPGLCNPQDIPPAGCLACTGLSIKLLLERFTCHFQQEDDKIIHTIKDIVPLRSVPKSVKKPDREKSDGRPHQFCHIFSHMFFSKFIPFSHEW